MTLKAPCEHGRYDSHFEWNVTLQKKEPCPGGALITVSDIHTCCEEGRTGSGRGAVTHSMSALLQGLRPLLLLLVLLFLIAAALSLRGRG